MNLLADGKFQQALDVATAELKTNPSDPSLRYVAGSAACALKRYDIGIEQLLNAIRNAPDGVRYEHREALESCVIAKHRSTAPQSSASIGTGTTLAAAPREFPAGESFSFSGSCGVNPDTGFVYDGKQTVGLKFSADGSIQYARDAGCGSQKVLGGRWTRAGSVIVMEFEDRDGGGRLMVGLSGTVTKLADGRQTIKIAKPFEPAFLKRLQ